MDPVRWSLTVLSHVAKNGMRVPSGRQMVLADYPTFHIIQLASLFISICLAIKGIKSVIDCASLPYHQGRIQQMPMRSYLITFSFFSVYLTQYIYGPNNWLSFYSKRKGNLFHLSVFPVFCVFFHKTGTLTIYLTTWFERVLIIGLTACKEPLNNSNINCQQPPLSFLEHTENIHLKR